MRLLKGIIFIALGALFASSAEAVVTTQGTIDELVLKINRDMSSYRQTREGFENRVKKLQDRVNNLSQEYQHASGDQRIIIRSRLLKHASELVGEYSGFMDTAKATISSTLSNLKSLKQIAGNSSMDDSWVKLDSRSKARLNVLYSTVARIALEVGDPELKKEVASILKGVGQPFKRPFQGRDLRKKIIDGIDLLIDRYSDLYAKLCLQNAKLQEDMENIKLTGKFTKYTVALRPLEEMIDKFEPNLPKIDISPVILDLEEGLVKKKPPQRSPADRTDTDKVLEDYINKGLFPEEGKR